MASQSTHSFCSDSRARTLLLNRGVESLDLATVPASILSDPLYPHREGRGVYIPMETHPGRFYYVKGAGSKESLDSAKTGKDWRKFPEFGHRDLGRYFFDSLHEGDLITANFPRIRGAFNLDGAINEYTNARIVYESVCRKEGISSIEEARQKGLTIPHSIIECPTITEEIVEALQRMREEVGAREAINLSGQVAYGMAILEVPACERLKKRHHINVQKGDFYTETLSNDSALLLVARTLQQQLAAGFVTRSTHLQNIYDAPGSICPQADNHDLVPISEILGQAKRLRMNKEDLLRILVMKQLEFLPFNLLRVKDDKIQALAMRGIHKILATILPGRWNPVTAAALAATSLKKPHTIFAQIADEFIDAGLVETAPQENWAKLYRTYRKFGYRDLLSEVINRTLEMSTEFESTLRRIEFGIK